MYMYVNVVCTYIYIWMCMYINCISCYIIYIYIYQIMSYTVYICVNIRLPSFTTSPTRISWCSCLNISIAVLLNVSVSKLQWWTQTRDLSALVSTSASFPECFRVWKNKSTRTPKWRVEQTLETPSSDIPWNTGSGWLIGILIMAYKSL